MEKTWYNNLAKSKKLCAFFPFPDIRDLEEHFDRVAKISKKKDEERKIQMEAERRVRAEKRKAKG